MARKKDAPPPKAPGKPEIRKPKAKGPKTKGPEEKGRGAEQRVARLRDKLTTAMQDPLTRDQIVRAIRALMQEK